MKRLQHLAEYALVRVLLGVADVLPLGAANWFARRFADLIYVLVGSRRRIALDNIARSGITADDAGIRRIARASFRHFAVLVVESLRSGAYFTDENPRGVVEWDLPESVQALLDDPERGLILASGHLGNWEIAAQLISRRKPVMGITRKMNNPYVERVIQDRKPRNDFYLTGKHEADVGRFFACLEKGDILALMIDQHARDRGMPIAFFGRPASTHTSIALLHLVTKVPICFGYGVRIGPMHYRFHVCEPYVHVRTGNKERDIREILELLTGRLEAAVRRHPEQYLWGHRRWRLD